MSIVIEMPGRPVPWARTGGKSGAHSRFTPKVQRLHKRALANLIWHETRGQAIEGAVGVRMIFDYEGEGLTTVELYPVAGGYTPRPDIDNLQKQVLDAIELSGAVLEDRYIVETTARKVPDFIPKGKRKRQ